MGALPPNRIDLTAAFPRVIGKLEADTYQPWHVGMERLSNTVYMRVVSGFRIKYLDDHPDRVWFLFIWPLKRGSLYGKGTPSTGQGIPRMEWGIPRCAYQTFLKNRAFLLKLAEVIGRARPYP